jgi:hypothetical protein
MPPSWPWPELTVLFWLLSVRLARPPAWVSKVRARKTNIEKRVASLSDLWKSAVNPDLARNCTTISPCQLDTTIIRDAELKANVVNECGRTELAGNIDIGENTENAIASKAVTQVKAGTRMTVTIHQVNADGAGPYACDLISAGNNGIITANLSIENNIPGANGLSQVKATDFNMTVIMPDSFPACTGCTSTCSHMVIAIK